jgi:hypothetical protein
MKRQQELYRARRKYSQEIGISSDFFNISFLLKVMGGDLEHIFVFVSENFNFFLGPKLIVPYRV